MLRINNTENANNIFTIFYSLVLGKAVFLVSNQTLLWASVILPWLSLAFLRKEVVKRYMPVALFGALTVVTITDLGTTLMWWTIKENIFLFHSVPPFIYGIYPVSIIWIFKYTSRNFWIFMATNFVIDAVSIFLIYPWFASKGMFEINLSSLMVLLLNLLMAAGLYGYQRWQEGVLVLPELEQQMSTRLQSAVAKPLPEDINENAWRDKER